MNYYTWNSSLWTQNTFFKQILQISQLTSSFPSELTIVCTSIFSRSIKAYYLLHSINNFYTIFSQLFNTDRSHNTHYGSAYIPTMPHD